MLWWKKLILYSIDDVTDLLEGVWDMKIIQRTVTVDISSLSSSKYATYKEKMKDSANGNKKI